MPGEDEKKCFTFIWKLENVSYCWQNGPEYLESPVFEVDELEETNWKLRLYELCGHYEEYIGFWLNRDAGIKDRGSVQLGYELAFLASDGRVLKSFEKKQQTIGINGSYGSSTFITRKEVFFEKRCEFLPRDTLTVCCRIWKSVGEFSKGVERYARTRIGVEKESLLWKIENFSTLESDVKKFYEIKSQDTGEQLVCLELFLTRRQILGEAIHISITPNFEIIKASILKLFVVDASNDVIECFLEEFRKVDSVNKKEFSRYLTKKELLKKKTVYLPNDVLSLRCEFSYSPGIIVQEISKIMSDYTTNEKNEFDDSEKGLIVPKCTLIDSLKSMVNNSSLSDVKLKTKNQTFAAHTFILGTRSPVFKAMFSNNMKEKIKEYVDIEDFNDDTVLRLLRFIYCADLEELEWDNAIQLYEAADKYEVLDLKNICSSFLKNNLRPSNACEALVLADMHQDDNLKSFVQNFILKHGKEVINSEEWEQLEETNLKLAYETIRLKLKE